MLELKSLLERQRQSLRTVSQEGAHLLDPLGAISVGEQAVAADFDEARRQDVQTEATEELL